MMNKNIPIINKKLLRKNSYSLKPVVIIGQNGLSQTLFYQKLMHRLMLMSLLKFVLENQIKINEMNNVYKFKKNLGAEIIHKIGFIVVFYRPKPKST